MAVACPGAANAGGCQLSRVAELPVTMDGLWPIVTLKIDGQPARFVVDSGAFYSILTPRAAAKFKLRPVALPSGFYIEGAVGTASATAGEASELLIDKAPLRKPQFLIAGDSLGDADGLLGQNILGIFDAEYDLANGVVRLFSTKNCDKAMLAYWATGAAAVSTMPIARATPIEPHIYGRATVNNLPIRVMFDTGAGRSMLKLSAALKAGADLQADESSAAGAMRGIGKRATDSYILPFSRFALGDETVMNIRLRVAKSDFTGADMLLGADFFLSHRVMVSQSQHRLYFTYNGGPVFRLDDAGVRSNPFAPMPAPADPTATKAGGQPAAAPQDADALRRRAAAAAVRRDFAHAINDLDAAIRLEPENATLFYDRARAKLSVQDAAGKADLDRALTLDPGLADALMLRGVMNLQTGQVAVADADLTAALKAAPDNADLALQIAAAYAETQHYAESVAHFDAWIAAHSTSFDLGKALNGRCWARALWGRELDLALADCNLALRKGSRLAGVLDSRGMVHLRRGEFALAIADYNEALKLQPKLAPSLFARGLARQKAGDVAGGAADMRAAVALAPKIAEYMRAFGITETTVVVASVR